VYGSATETNNLAIFTTNLIRHLIRKIGAQTLVVFYQHLLTFTIELILTRNVIFKVT